jgi:hypothetical protein
MKYAVNSMHELLKITKALETFKYMCYGLMNDKNIDQKKYRDFIMTHAPCNYGDLNRFTNAINKLNEGIK